MALIDSFSKTGSWLFKYRGIIPLFIFILALPFFLIDNPLSVYFYDSTAFRIIISTLSILISLSGLFVRCYTIGTTPRGTSGRNTEKQIAKQLNTSGIYSIVRHPLYLGNYLMWAGILLYTVNIAIFIIVSLIFWLYYERIMFTEETFLSSQFGDEFRIWSMKVPPFVPNFRLFNKGNIPFSVKTVLRREYSGLLALTLMFTFIDYFRTFIHEYPNYSNIKWGRTSIVILIIIVIITLILRSLKHYTKVLDRSEGRD